jgi:hypothetical protein
VSEYRDSIPNRPEWLLIEHIAICVCVRESANDHSVSVTRIFHALQQGAMLDARVRSKLYAADTLSGGAKGTLLRDFPVRPSPE